MLVGMYARVMLKCEFTQRASLISAGWRMFRSYVPWFERFFIFCRGFAEIPRVLIRRKDIKRLGWHL